MDVEDILAKLVSFPVLGGDSNLNIIYWIKEYIETYDVETTLVPNKKKLKRLYIVELGQQ